MSRALKRRGILAASGAVVTGLLLRETQRHVQAALIPLQASDSPAGGPTINTAAETVVIRASANFATGNTYLMELDSSPSPIRSIAFM